MSSLSGGYGPSLEAGGLAKVSVDTFEARRASVGKYEDEDLICDNVNSPGASSTSSEPDYIRQPGFDQHAHSVKLGPCISLSKPNSEIPKERPKFLTPVFPRQELKPVVLRSNFFPSCPPTPTSPSISDNESFTYRNFIYALESKLPVDSSHPSAKSREGSEHSPPSYSSTKGCKKKKGSNSPKEASNVKTRVKREPLPMKLRALPPSFWLQPNKSNPVPPSTSSLPPLILGKDVTDVIDELPITPPSGKDSKWEPRVGERIIKVGNTDLLLKLFDSVEKNEKKIPQVVRRGRPKKSTSHTPIRTFRNEDPCLISTATESILPLLLDSTPFSSRSSTPLGMRHHHGQQVRALEAWQHGQEPGLKRPNSKA